MGSFIDRVELWEHESRLSETLRELALHRLLATPSPQPIGALRSRQRCRWLISTSDWGPVFARTATSRRVLFGQMPTFQTSGNRESLLCPLSRLNTPGRICGRK